MTVKELIEILATLDPNKTVAITVERGYGHTGSDDFGVCDGDEFVSLCGDETFYE